MRDSEAARDLVVVGRSCRLPGASSVDELWTNLLAGRCSVTSVPPDRWSLSKHGHPRPKEPGKSYVWAAGVIDHVWDFDPTVFGISPREAEQMDPQQRLMLELTWEALEDAGLRRQDLAGTEVGVFVGASSTEYQNIRNTDIAGGDAYTATGGALSIVSNRISHAFDFRGPSFTVDTACSSSLVALHQAMEALRSGRIDTAVVGGINLLLSPFGFVIFSQASMLSPGGLCRTFDAKADGYVRGEGGVVLVLQTAERAARDHSRIHARLVTSGINSDGRTNGIALPSRFSQAKLLADLYARAGIEPDQIAFVEAHGTGTRVGDPIEAGTIGDVLGRKRSQPLPIGSIKSNIGHLEPASGLAGVLKAMLALSHDVLPPSVNFDEPNPDIPFDDLNLHVCTVATALPRGAGPRFAGINSFGFGGTNAHIVIGDAPATSGRPIAYRGTSDLFAFSAAGKPAVRDLARRYADLLGSASFEQAREIVAAAAHRREMLTERVVVEWSSPRELARKLERIADKETDVPGVTSGTVTDANGPVAFVFSGNGSQWPGMGRDAYRINRRFRETFDEIDSLFDDDFGWSITEALFSPDIDERLKRTHLAQPLIFATQIAVARTLSAEGLEPSFTLGHSVGEIAAATVAGALTLRDAVKVIQSRSAHQEIAWNAGRMAVLVAPRETVEEFCLEVGGVEIAAENAARAFTVAGTTEGVARIGALARKRRIVFRQLDLDYPFHCSLIDPVREPLLKDLAGLRAQAPRIEMISTVTGEPVTEPLDAEYWWHNVREPVRFSTALQRAAADGARIFVEIGPRSVLLSNIRESLEGTGLPCAALGTLERRDAPDERDPIRPAVLRAFTHGAPVEFEKLFGPEPTRPVALPTYPWNRRDFRAGETGEAVGSTLNTKWHRLAGARATAEGVEWSNLLDTASLPELADHEVGGQPILPAAAFVEMALFVAREWFGSDRASLLEIDISQPLVLEFERAREVKSRLSPATNMLEILSRPRLSRAGWTLHATARLTPGGEEAIATALPSEDGLPVSADEIYRAAEAVGLRYGPSFRLLGSVRRIGTATLVADLLPATPAGRYGIDPALVDAAFHGLFALLGDLGAENRGMAYIPVRLGHTRLVRPAAIPRRALIEVRKAGEGSIVADFTLFDAEGVAIAHLHDARFQAARIRRVNRLSDKALVAEPVAIDRGAIGQAGSPVRAGALLEAAGSCSDAATAGLPDEQALLEGWASSVGLRLASAMAEHGEIEPDRLRGLGEPASRWLLRILRSLEAGGLATERDGRWTLAEPGRLPDPRAILRTIAADYPNRSAELFLAGPFTECSDPSHALSPSPGAVDGFELGGWPIRRASELVDGVLVEAGLFGSDVRGLRILQIGYGPLSHALAERAARAEARLTILDLDARRAERAKLALRGADIAVTDSLGALTASGYDLVVSAEGLHRLVRAGGSLATLRSLLAPGALLALAEPAPSAFRGLVFGLQDGWFGGRDGDAAASSVRSADEWVEELRTCGFVEVSARALTTGSDEVSLIVAEAARTGSPADEDRRAIAIHAQDRGNAGEFARQIDAVLALDGHDVSLAGRDAGSNDAGARDGTVIVVASAAGGKRDLADLRDASLFVAEAALAALAKVREVWVVVPCGRGRRAGADPVAAGVLAFARTFANETAAVTVRRVAVEAGIGPAEAAEALRSLMARPQSETDFVIGAAGITVQRIVPLEASASTAAGPAVEAARLERGHAGGLGGLAWRPAEWRAPGAGEVEIAVEATALNFRDVMWAMSLLPDDILEDGYAGPTLGLECAGTVTRIGRGASRFRPGDRVLAFAPSAFSTRVAVPDGVVAPIPADWTTEAAAGVPVAFLTAYYGLITLGGLKAGDWVLIHGAAGGVGLAAIQIAAWRGANVIATAGSPEKRALLNALGVEHVLNSRSAAFADGIRSIRREGVDIVLNSLSGEAMERGLSTLKPFGRFIELGKRDYVANTRIGLRPFRRNLSYFGVDVDQLLSDRDRASLIFGEIMRLFDSGDLKPLPYRVFSAAETGDAFRLMQQSGHIGKILLRPPSSVPAGPPAARFGFDPDKTHLITGGFGGFGLETARWLADRGVRNLVIVGRSGPKGEEAEALVAELVGRGVKVLAECCDVSDRQAVMRLLATISRDMPPLGGILHAAMVLDDGLVAGLTPEQMTRVLEPKVAGAAHLDALTAKLDLDYFVMFSSITTFIGNPGQGAYVAANGYLEGLARLRRERGQNGLAIAWGAISDVGILARQKGLAEALSKRVGVKAMPAREALDLMAQALARDPSDPAGGVLAVGSLDWSAARRLPALSSPTFAGLMRDGSVADASDRQGIDLKALLASEPVEAVRARVVDLIVDEIASVLRIPKAEVSTTKRLSEMGLDSLMAIELASGLQSRFDLDAPPTGSVGGLTTLGLAEQMIGLVSSGHPDEEIRVTQALNDRHAQIDIDVDTISPVMQAVTARTRDLKGLMH